MPLKRKHLRPAVALAATLGLLLAMGWWVGELRARSTDAEMRKDLLRQTVSIANTINPELARNLTFTAADKDTPAFEQLRKHFIAVGKSLSQRGIYSMILREGAIFFGPENYPENDPMATPPGTVYKQPPPEFFPIFKDKRPVTVGPVTDEYGTFVSAVAPVLDPHSNEVLMVVAVDILAGDWQARLNAARRGPFLIMLVSILLLSGGTIAIRRRNRHMKPDTLKFKVWIVAPTALAMLGGLMLYGAYEYQAFDEGSLHEMLRVTEQARDEWNRNIASEAQLLKAQIDHIARNPGMLKAWQDRDFSTLTGLAQPVHEQLEREYGITHFYFMAPDRTIFLRVHQPDRRADRIDRFTLLAAEQTGEDAWGVELGPLGTFTLRYVRPWKQDGTTTGYLELGMEIEHLGRQLARDMDLDLLIALQKEYTSREKFEAGREAFGFAGQWDAYPDFVVAHQTIPLLPGEVAHWLEHDHNPAIEIGVFNARLGEKRFACGSIHLPDATGRGVADLVVMQDVTTEAGAAQGALFQELSMMVVLFGGLLVLLWSVTGTAERQLGTAFARLRESEESYRRQFSDNSAVMLLFDPADARIKDANAAALSFYGYSRERLLAMRITEINTLSASEVLRCMASVTEEHGQKFEFQHRLADGSVRDVEVSSSLIHLANRKVLHSIIHDITERKRAEDEKAKLEAQNRQLQKAESLGHMAGAIAHHFNNQLGAVMGNLELAMAALPRGAGPVENLTEAMRAARRAAEVSGLMLTYLGQTRGKREPLDLSETCRRSLPMLQAAMPKDVVLKTDLPSPGPAINANANQIQQVLTNLCTNAWEAVGDGRGVIHLIVKAVSAADIPAAPRFPLDWPPQDTTYACLEVADAGCGIAGQDIEKLFDPFFSRKFAGRGLGLPVALGIVRTHGGVITVQSEPGHGSVFRVFFPVSAEAVPRQPKKVANAPEIEGGGTVLLVEDEEMVRDMAARMLTHLGFSVLAARDGVEAMEVFRQRQDEIRFVLCDLTMPRMDGWETLAALRELSPGIPMILTSGYNEAQVMGGDHPKFPEAFLSKPYGFKELSDAIARALANKK